MDASKMDVDDGGTGAQVPADSSADDRCPICWNGITHRIKLPCSHEFCFLCAKGAVLRSSTCPMCRGAVPADFFDHCTINSENVNIATFEGTYHWYYSGRNGWWLFDSRVSQEIEEQYQKRRQRLLAAAAAAATASADTSAATTSDAIVSSSAAIPIPTISNTSASRPDSTGSDLAGAVNVINLDDTDDTVDTVDAEDTEEEDEDDEEEEEEEDDYDDEDDDEEEEDDLDINFINALAEDEDEEADPDAQPSPGVDQCEVMIAGFMYMIDFAAMIQYRRDSPSRIRRIKRDQAEANTKGIAGLRGNINFI